ncbi:AraC-like DNA-binding protein [Aquimarina sp. EL_43]|uniref:helix-turn-helix domain-containing protein n=1 Tax=unclassified Aquimarina TaxID=2627091 RepID=UPI0018CB253B|nr:MULTISPECIES: helix-turn-helix domain-containing protein [unclassified Aquimarina]MBG6128579.1 AraC-like DNA-binding protein [Aquimarina sp. EL_35]MBG6149642.1 AraC-like DNA-binding protein [Aquimarina sp. EL_32]MBG6167673.1 AraC-like DNA-binding protein [Aquimarina sp. EL_43]
MIKEFKEFSTGAVLKIANEELLQSYTTSKLVELYTFIWVRSTDTSIEIDGISTTVKKDKIIVLTPNQYFKFIDGSDILVYQFNREFYCIKDHDKEVSCVGVLFHGNTTISIVELNIKEQNKLDQLHKVFLDELDTVDTIQAEMLRMLMARFIITTTRLIKQQSNYNNLGDQVDLIRNFNILVDTHFRKEHAVGFYAQKLFKSPKTLSNNFAKFEKSPLQIIHDRIILEAKRLLIYTDKSAKEIAYEIGFEDASHLSRMFKRHTSLSPSEFKKQLKPESEGKY